MLYKAKFVPRDGFVADADLLMREFQRAEEAGNNLDQNNLADLGVIFANSFAPSGSANSTTFTHDDDTGLLIIDPNPGTAKAMTLITSGTEKTSRGAWIPIGDGTSDNDPVALEFTLNSSMWMVLVGQVEWSCATGTSATYFGIRLRLVADGKPLDTISTVPAVQSGSGTVYWSGYVEQNVFLDAGAHRITMLGSELRQNDAQVAHVTRRTILGMGFAR